MTWRASTDSNTELPNQNSSHTMHYVLQCLCMSVYDIQYESIRTRAEQVAWPWHGTCSEFRPSGLVWLYWAACWLAWMSNDTGSWSLQTHWRWEALCIVCQWVGIGYLFANASSCCPHTNFLSSTDTPVQKYEVQVGAGIWHINAFFFFHSLP